MLGLMVVLLGGSFTLSKCQCFHLQTCTYLLTLTEFIFVLPSHSVSSIRCHFRNKCAVTMTVISENIPSPNLRWGN